MDTTLKLCWELPAASVHVSDQICKLVRSEIYFHQYSDVTAYSYKIKKQHHLSHTTYVRGAHDVHSEQQCGQQTHSDFKEELSETMIKKCNDYKCLAPFRRRQCHCCCYPAYQSCWLIIPLWWHQFYGLWNASQCFHNAIQLGYSIHHWAGESLLIGWRADCHSPAEEGHGFWRSGHSHSGKRNGGCEGALCRGAT